jgi:hypothetical protein
MLACFAEADLGAGADEEAHGEPNARKDRNSIHLAVLACEPLAFSTAIWLIRPIVSVFSDGCRSTAGQIDLIRVCASAGPDFGRLRRW